MELCVCNSHVLPELDDRLLWHPGSRRTAHYQAGQSLVRIKWVETHDHTGIVAKRSWIAEISCLQLSSSILSSSFKSLLNHCWH